MKAAIDSRTQASFSVVGPNNGMLKIALNGDWAAPWDEKTSAVLKDTQSYLMSINTDSNAEPVKRVEFDGAALTAWDSRTLVGIASVSRQLEKRGVSISLDGMPDGMLGLLRLSQAVPSRGENRDSGGSKSVLVLIGQSAIDAHKTLAEANLFLGQSLQSMGRFMRGKVHFRRSDIIEFIEINGPLALPIVGIINVLLGVILAFMGAVQLQQFGAQIYVADLVALGQVREIAPMMTGIVMAGRTGAAYAAQLGTMQVNEEIDALKTFGFSPMDYLVLPRILALAIMFPLLVLYADALGIFGGYLIGVGVLDLSTTEYIEQTRKAIDMGDILLGIVKGSVFGILVAVTGCMHGMQSGRSASAVGDATTKAVVSGIIAIIFMTVVFAVLTNLLKI